MSLMAAILAGGMGTRLQDVLPYTPKVLAPVNGRPFITRLLQQLLRAGIVDTVLCTGHLGAQIQQCLGTRYESMSLTYSIEQEPLGTAGAIRHALPAFSGDTLLVMNGDSSVDVPLAPFIERGSIRSDRGTMLLTRVEDCSRFGTVEVDGEENIVSFREKDGCALPGWINAGVYLFPTAWIGDLPPGIALSLEREVLPRWLSRGIAGFKVAGPFIDIGTPETLDLAGSFFAD